MELATAIGNNKWICTAFLFVHIISKPEEVTDMSVEEQDVIRNIINILAREDHITVDEKLRMLETLKKEYHE